MPSGYQPDDAQAELAETLQELKVVKRKVVAGAIGYGLDQVARPERLEALTEAELELVRRIAQQRPAWIDESCVDLADPMVTELLEILRRAQERLKLAG